MARVLSPEASPAVADRPELASRWASRAVLAGYLAAAVVVTWRLWADPAARTVAGNPGDADLFAWFLRYAATALAHGRLPALVTTALNAPAGINVMWNTSILLPGVLLTPVTLLFGPQVSLTVLGTAGFAGSAASLFWVLRRWQVSTQAAALAGAVYGFSPALLHSAIGHYNLQVAILPPLIIDLGLRITIGPPREMLVVSGPRQPGSRSGRNGSPITASRRMSGTTAPTRVMRRPAGRPALALAEGRRHHRGQGRQLGPDGLEAGPDQVADPPDPRAAHGPPDEAGSRWSARVPATVRDGCLLGLLVTAQLFTSEELLLVTGMAGLLLVAGLAASRPRAVRRRLRPAAAGLAMAAGVTAALGGWALWVQFAGPLTEHGSAFLADFFVNDLTGFVTPSRYLLFHTAASAAAAGRYQGGPPEYLAYLGWPLIAVLAVATLAAWRRPAVRAMALTLAVLELLSLGGHPLVGGHSDPGVTLPWHLLEAIPVLTSAIPDRLSIVADGAAAALLALCVDLARARLAQVGRSTTSRSVPEPGPAEAQQTQHRRFALWPGRLRGNVSRDSELGQARALSFTNRRLEPRARSFLPGRGAGVVTVLALIICLPLIPRPLPAASPARLPAGWSAAFAALRLPAGARVLVVPVPTPTLTAAMRWQADTGQPDSLIGGYFIGPAWTGQAYVGGNGVTATARYLDQLWISGLRPGDPGFPAVAAAGSPAAAAPSASQLVSDLATWQPAAVVAVTVLDSPLGHYLIQLFGPPTVQAGSVLGWHL